ncbi:endoribonuclease Dcr-1 [Pieris brassicae]|uniref:endoribonuclease Dcr-1 n=1 Tax=Pieris brassicae TaxID=7116 RepID=UPI001E65FDDD|nr:endoribonuclease Dcr-1 [Pieris brassicae]XP_045525419.1 endoribonuclease Dcr-1 [Pieris brassicae]XP_045525420.1 endoribonuclease Dcr-1 [Pieris brassicae]XP_045525421.1 endoribonuclease Dcr-1 [Pieris brassicae]
MESCSRLTAAEGGARLAAAAGTKNIMITEHTNFIPTSLLIECAHGIRGTLLSGFKRSVYIARSSQISCVAHELMILTDLQVIGVKDYNEIEDWKLELENRQVLVCTSAVFNQILENDLLKMTDLNVLIIDSCHLVFRDIHLQHIMQLYKDCDNDNRPRILAMTYPLFQSTKDNMENNDNVNDSENDTSNTSINDENKSDIDMRRISENELKNNDVSRNLSEISKEKINDSPKMDQVDDKINIQSKLGDEINKDNKNAIDKVIKVREGEKETKESVDCDLIEDVNNVIENIDKIKTKGQDKSLCTIDYDNILMQVYKNCDDFDMYEKLEWKIEEMEKQLCCEMDLAEDIDGGKRLSPSTTKPKEVIVEYGNVSDKISDPYKELESFMRNTINDAFQFINEHRYDPTEIYGEELYEEFINIPDPTIEPKDIFCQFLYVLDELGPYAADKAAFSLLTKLEKLKIKVPYERHFLLLCLCTSVFVKIRCYADFIFSKYESDWEKLALFSTQKVLRFAAILEQFRPDDTKDSNKVEVKINQEICENESNKITDTNNEGDKASYEFESHQTKSDQSCCNELTSQHTDDEVLEPKVITKDNATDFDNTGLKRSRTIELLDEINKCDFTSLGDKIEDTVNVIQCDLKEFDANFRNETRETESSLNENQATLKSVDENVDKSNKTVNKVTTEIKIIANIQKEVKTIDIVHAVEQGHSTDVEINKIDRPTNIESDQNATNDLETSNTSKEKSTNDNDVINNSDKSTQVNVKQVINNSEVTGNRSVLVKSDVKTSESDDQKTFKRGRGRGRRKLNVKSQLQTSDSLCGIVFMNEPLMAKIMFMMIIDMSRSRPSLSHLCAQYCAVETVQEPREHQRQGRKQEDVLKKFRMHECNLLLATSALEEGIDLPRCNLVVRWDVPPSYRSYGLCRSRARAAKSSVSLLANADRHSTLLVHNLAVYKELDQIVTRKCGCGIQNEPPQEEEIEADTYTSCIKAYKPSNRTVIHKINEINTSINDINGIDTEKEEIVVDFGGNSKKTKDKEEGSEEIKRSKENCTECIENQINSEDVKQEIVFDDLNEKSEVEDTEKNNVNVKEKSMHISENNILDFREVRISGTIQQTSDKVNSEAKITYSVERSEEASVDLNSAIALINRYCGKLPSDTFTRLAPQWWMEEVRIPAGNEMKTAYICTLRMPLNCPVKYNIVGHPMPTRVLARRMVALQACRILHKSGELDDQLMPIGKENFKAAEMDSNLNQEMDNNDSARPGTTKRRQYYFKRTAWAFTDCQPIIDTNDADIEANPIPKIRPILPAGTKRNMLYAIVSNLWCALPERYNTRGRKLHLPQHADQAIGILVARCEPTKLQIPAFPVYTRSGEVRISVEPALDADVRLSPRRARLVRRFMRFVFSDVLRVRRRGMKLQTEGSTQNNYYIVPTVKRTTETGTAVDIDWAFLELIFKHTEGKKIQEQENSALWEKKEKGQIENPLLRPGDVFEFDPEKYNEAVVTPWYRNQDQPQFFLVAEICWHLTPDSAFPSDQHATFRSYYKAKYGADLTQNDQPLLDVDHTSARLNLLTPRYVNRKGVALPVSSERTRRAKRDRLDQKQIMVPELCKVHPFAAPLWFATVALPCVLYRINALLIADEIRRAVALDVGLGIPRIDDDSCPGFTWPALDFGWSLAEVLSADSEKHDKKKEIEDWNQSDDLEKEQRDKEEQENLQKTEEESQEPKEKTINDILQEKEEAESGFEIGTWSNEMASSIPQTMEYDEFMEPLPPNLTFCTSATGGANWSDPIEKPKHFSGRKFSMAESDCSYLSSDFDTDDSDFNSDGSDEDSDGFSSSKNANAAMGVRIEYKTAHEAEAVDVERRRPVAPAPMPDRDDDMRDVAAYKEILKDGTPPEQHVTKFRNSVISHEKEIIAGHLIRRSDTIKYLLPEGRDTDEHINKNVDSLKVILSKNNLVYQQSSNSTKNGVTEANSDNNDNVKEISKTDITKDKISDMFPYLNGIDTDNGQITLEAIEKNKRTLLSEIKKTLTDEEIKKFNCFSMVDIDIDATDYVNEKIANVGFDSKDKYEELVNRWDSSDLKPYYLDQCQSGKDFDFDYQPSLEGHPGPSPSVILQALTMSNANDGINLERLETIGDSFLKFAITAYLYCAHPAVHEGKLSHMRSKQVSNLNLYRLGRNKRLGARMIASKFEPHDNWLPPCHKPPHTMQPGHDQDEGEKKVPIDNTGCFIPYNLITQHSIPDKSIADCVEALIGAYLLECGPRGALLFMSWLGIRVLPCHLLDLPLDHPYVQRQNYQATTSVEEKPPQKTFEPLSSDSESCCSSDEEGAPDSQPPPEDWSWTGRPVGSLRPYRDAAGKWVQPVFGELKAPPSPLLRYIEDPEGELEQMLSGYEELEKTLQYRFRDRSLLLQALTHASHQKNRLTDCYQRLEFLGDAILDYLITRHLYEDPRRHSPGALTDLRSALVNNTIFATLAARHGFHKYFRHMSPGLNEVLTKYVKIQEENGHSISEEHYLIQEDEMEQAEDVEVPKALGDLFESVAGAIFLDSGMSLGAVWRSYARLMMAELEAFSAAAPKSPVRELLEAEPDTAKFGKPERLADGRRVRVCVEVFGRGTFKGIGRNYRIAKGTAARCALRHLKIHRGR